MRLMAFPESGRSILHEVAQTITSGQFEVDEFRQETGRLDEVFRDLTTDTHATEEGGQL